MTSRPRVYSRAGTIFGQCALIRGLLWAPLVLVALAAPVTYAQSATFTTLYSFGGPDGSGPGGPGSASLIQAADGNLYGTTTTGGSNNGGTLYRLTTSGSLTTLYSFPVNGVESTPSTPFAVLQGQDGALYGVTHGGAIVNQMLSGTVFKYASDGTFTTLAAFESNFPSGLVQGSDGNFYTTTLGPIFVLYQVTPGGVSTALHTFNCACAIGPQPSGSLVEGAPLTFYGAYYDQIDTTVIYSATATGTVETVASLPINSFPGTLTVGPDKALYGITAGFGDYGSGMVYRLQTSGTWTILYSFNAGGQGSTPEGSVVFGPDGTLYGYTTGGGNTAGSCGSFGCGVIYSLTPAGTYTVLYQFTDAEDGSMPANLLVGSDGALYGTTATAGAHGLGSVFRITLPSASPPSPPSTGGGATGGGGGAADLASLVSLALAIGIRLRRQLRPSVKGRRYLGANHQASRTKPESRITYARCTFRD
jgi:uncharacterized repeat protein (TIGR03803 family)